MERNTCPKPLKYSARANTPADEQFKKYIKAIKQKAKRGFVEALTKFQGFTLSYMCSLSSVTVTHAIQCHAMPVKNNHVYTLYSTQLYSQRKPCFKLKRKYTTWSLAILRNNNNIINILTRCFYTLQKSKARLLFFKFKPL